MSVQCSPHLSFRPIPPVSYTTKWGLLASVHEVRLDGVHSSLERQNVLERMIFKRWPFLVSPFACQKIFYKLFIHWFSERAPPDGCKHFSRRIVSRHSNHGLHEAQLAIIRDCEEISLLSLPPFRALRDVCRLSCAIEPGQRICFITS